MATFYWRHGSTDSNKNRGRANAISRALLCDDHLQRQVSFPPDLDLTDPAISENAVNTNGSCLACHAQLEPLASALWGFSYFDPSRADMTAYHPDRELSWTRQGGVAPALSGTALTGLADLGRAVANDPRFVDCAVSRVMEGLYGRGLEVADERERLSHRAAFIEGGLKLKALVASVIATSLPGRPSTSRTEVWQALGP